MWSGYHYAVVVGPLAGLDAPGLRRRLAAWTATIPVLAVSRAADPATWSPIPSDALGEHLQRLVVEGDLDGTAASIERVLAEPLDGLPVRLIVGKDHLAIHTDHVFGDATTVASLHGWLVRQAVGIDAVPPAQAPGLRSPYRLALSHTFGGRPPMGTLRRTAKSILVERRAQSAEAAPITWDHVPSLELAAGGAAGTAAIRAFRREHAPGLSGGMVLMAAAWYSLVEHGVIAHHLRPAIGMDLRRYLPRRSVVDGNFTAIVRLPAGTSAHPVELRDTVEALSADGAPLLAACAQATLGSVRARFRGVRSTIPTWVLDPRGHGGAPAGHHSPSLVMNFLGRASSWDTLPWVGGVAQTFVAAPSVESSRSLTLNMHDRVEGFHITASFFASVTPRGAVRAALADLTERLPEVLAQMQERRTPA